MTTSTMNILIQDNHYHEMLRHADRQHPNECCGILMGEPSGQNILIRRVIQAGNISELEKTRSYQIDWQTLFDAVRASRSGHERIIGFYHSHPDGSNQPSRSDHRSAWIDHSYIIITKQPGHSYQMTSWRIPHENSRFEPERIIFSSSDSASHPLTSTDPILYANGLLP